MEKLSTLLKEIKSKHKRDFYCLNSSHLFRTKNKLDSHEKVWKIHNYCEAVIPDDEIKWLEYYQG